MKDDLGLKVCEILGLDVRAVESVTIKLEAEKVPKIVVKLFVRELDDELGEEVAEFILEPRWVRKPEPGVHRWDLRSGHWWCAICGANGGGEPAPANEYPCEGYKVTPTNTCGTQS